MYLQADIDKDDRKDGKPSFCPQKGRRSFHRISIQVQSTEPDLLWARKFSKMIPFS